MGKTRWARCAAALALALAPAIAPAAGTHTLTIGATILAAGNCRFETPGPTLMDFGVIDPSSVANATASVNIPFRCNGGGSSPTIVWFVSGNDGQYETGPGAPRMRHAVNAAEYLRYSLSIPASGTAAKNAISNLTVNGTILVADFAAALAGTYTDSVVLTIAP